MPTTPQAVRSWLPRYGKGHILLTSRARVFDALGIGTPIEIREMTPGEAVEFLFKRTGRQDGDAAESKAAAELAKELGYLPLALEQGAAYVAEKQARFQDYLASYRARRLELLGKGKPVAGEYPESVATTWSLNFEEVEKMPAAADLLRFSAFLSSDHVPLELIGEGASGLGPALSTALGGVKDDPVALDEVLEPLTRFSLIWRDIGARTYSIHRLVQEVVRSRMDETERRLWAERAVRAMSQAFPSTEYETWPSCERLLPHAREAADLIEVLRFESPEAAHLLNQLGSYLKERAQVDDIGANDTGTIMKANEDRKWALRYTQRALAILQDKGDREGVLRCTQTVLEIDEKVYGPEHLNVARDANNIGQILQDKGDLEGARRYFERALRIFEKTYGPENSLTKSAAQNLAGVKRPRSQEAGR